MKPAGARIDDAVPVAPRTQVDYERLLQALLRARNAFGPESELRRMENLPALTLWTNVLRLDAMVREIRQRLAAQSRAAPPVLTRHVRRPGDEE